MRVACVLRGERGEGMSEVISYNVHDETMAQLMDAYGTALFRLCYFMLKDYALAEDAVQETFVKAYKGLAQFQNKNDFSEKSWLNKIAMNTCKDFRRNAWFRLVDRKADMEEFPPPTVEIDDGPELMEAILKLPVKYREVILLYYYENIKYEELAKILSISLSTAHARLAKAKQKLRALLEGRAQI